MLPDFELFGKKISLYNLCALIGILIVFAFSQIYTKKKKHDEIIMLFLLLYAAIGVIVGGHLLYAITMFDYFKTIFNNPIITRDFNEFVKWGVSVFGGSVFYGGLLGGIFTSFIFIKNQRKDMDSYIGIGTLCIPLFHFIGRIGCFLSGCCYGVESSFGFDLKYSSAPDCAGVIRFPVQLLEASLNLIIFIILLYMDYKKKLSGKKILLYYLISYSSARFLLEFLRGDSYRGFVGAFSTSQIISMIIFTFCIFFSNKKAYLLNDSFMLK